MPKTRLISPGSIPNHKLLKNLQLQNNYISNDGDDEGIGINDDGHITFTEDGSAGKKVFFDIDEGKLRIHDAILDYFTIDVDNNAATTISTTDFFSALGHLSLKPDGNCIIDVGITPANYTQIDRNITSSAADTNGAALWLDYDRTGSVTSGTDINTGLDFDMNVTGAGTSGTPTVTTVGIDMDIVGDNAGSGTSTVTGLDINVSGADTNYAIITTGGNVGIGVPDPDTALEIMVDGSPQLKLSKDATDYITIEAGSTTDITATSTIDINVGSGDNVRIYESTALRFLFGNSGSHTEFKMNSAASTSDYFKIECQTEGATVISTYDNDTAVAHLTIVADGHVEFDNCAVGFDKLAGAFGTSQVLGGVNDSTDIDFRLSNKYELELTNNLDGIVISEFLNLIFPAVSGNFILVISQDGTGSRTIHSSAWTAYQSDGATKATNAAFANGTDGDLRWAGGTAPSLTATADKSDIVSIYWDADNQTAFAVISQNF